MLCIIFYFTAVLPLGVTDIDVNLRSLLSMHYIGNINEFCCVTPLFYAGYGYPQITRFSTGRAV